MKRLGWRTFAAALGLLVLLGTAVADDTWRVVRSVRMLTKPSTTEGLKIKTLHPPELVTATGGKNGDYIRVRDESDDLGWVYAPFLTEAPAEEGEVSAPTGETTLPSEPAGIANAIATSWDKPAPQASSFHLNGKTCGPTGTGTEIETNRRKNRTDVPVSYHAVTFEAADQLPFPDAPTQRSQWTSPELAAIAPYEGVALTVTGYLVALKPQSGNSESCNCGWSGPDETDWHMALTAHPGDKEKDAMVVETTPRIRINHPMWTTTNLAHWKNGPDPIRVSGWLMMDPQHKSHLHPHGTTPAYRNTLWEIHPITKIEVMQNGTWVDLDHLSGPS